MHLIFKNNIVAQIDELFQWKLFHDVIEGVPTPGICENEITNTIQRAVNFFGHKNPCVIKPNIIISKGREITPGMYGRQRGELPKYACIAELKIWHNDLVYGLSIVFFQNEFAPPIAEEISRQLKEIDFLEFAEDLGW